MISDKEVSPEQLEFIRSYYKEKLSGSIIPIWFSAIRYFDFENDENIYLAVKVSRQQGNKQIADYAFLELPVNICGRFIRLPDNEEKSYLIYLDDVIRCVCLWFSKD